MRRLTSHVPGAFVLPVIVIAGQPLDPPVRRMKAAVLDRLQTAHHVLEVDSLAALEAALDQGLEEMKAAGLTAGLVRMFFFGDARSPLALAIAARMAPGADLIVVPQPAGWIALYEDLPALTRMARRLEPGWQPTAEA